MEGRVECFIIWAVMGIFFIGMGIHHLYSKKSSAAPFGFWANADVFPVNDVKAYNRALGKLWIVFGTVFILTGTPFLSASKSALSILFPILGLMAESIAAMAVYITVIEKKYRKR